MTTRRTAVTTRRLCLALGISKSKAIRWSQEGCPHTITPKGFRWDLPAVRRWVVDTHAVPNADLAAAKLRAQAVRIEEMQFKLGILKGECVERVKVDKYLFESARQVRDGMLALPDRLSAMLTAESDAHRCHEILTQEIARVLEGLSTQPPWGDGAA